MSGGSGPTPLWGGRFSKLPAEEAARLGRSLEFDIEMLDFDIGASVAHVRGLADAGLLTEEEARSLEEALGAVPEQLEELDAGAFAEIEDVHLLVERLVTDRLGDLGAKLHAGRSRNDLVVTDFRLWSLGACGMIVEQVEELLRVLVRRIREGAEWVMPGFTHDRPAQVVTLGYVLAAHAFGLLRDLERLEDWTSRAAVSPLGAGALATTTLDLDPEKTAERLGLLGAFENGLDAVADRDFVVEFAAALAILGVHMSRLAADFARWSDPRLGYARIDEAYSTGSSMMPQKRNPDVLELVRGKAARLAGDLTTVVSLTAGLPLGYHRDLQEDKEPVFDAVLTIATALPALVGCVATATIDPEAMRRDCEDESLYATDLAEALVVSSVPFRDAHRRTGELLRRLEGEGRGLHELTAAEWKEFGVPGGGGMLDPDRSVRARKMPGGPSPDSVRSQADAIEGRLGA